MTARRRAIAAAGRPAAGGRRTGRPPAQLLDPGADVWCDLGAFLAFMAARGWDLPPPERVGGESSRENRRAAAAEAWAVEAGHAREGHVSWTLLRAHGLIE